MKDKLAFIENLKKDNNETVLKKLATIQRLSQDKNSEVRQELASWLVLFDIDLRCDKNVDNRVKVFCKDFAKWLRKEYFFPIKVTVYVKENYRIKANI